MIQFNCSINTSASRDLAKLEHAFKAGTIILSDFKVSQGGVLISLMGLLFK
jgi:hypothetical protein